MTRSARRNLKMGTAFVRTPIDDHFRVAYAEIHDDETAVTTVTVLRNPLAWFAARGVVTARVLSDNGCCYVSRLWRDVYTELGIVHKRATYRPRSTARSNDSTARWPKDGRSAGSTMPKQLGVRPWRHGSASTTTTGPTP